MNVTGADEQQDIVCENGGSPAGDYCSCPIGFVGTHCETGKVAILHFVVNLRQCLISPLYVTTSRYDFVCKYLWKRRGFMKEEEFKDVKGIIRIRNLKKDIEHNAKIKGTKGQKGIYKTPHTKLKSEKHEPD